MNLLAVFLGGGAGSLLRHLVTLSLPATAFPWATFAVNAIGSFAIGLFGGWSARFGWSEPL
ncbi:MAG: CrcB family protein, partial [Fibrobacterales bacterium]|nr:CrcB family protein [Fibrobacterales bacterium]